MRRALTGFLALAVGGAAVSIVSDAHAADPTASECISLNEKAGPLQKAGKLREARADLLRCSASSCPAVVRDDCVKGATTLDSAVPTVVFAAQDGAKNDLSAVTVTVDGEPLTARLTGNPLDVDPGEHVFRFEAKGLLPLEKHFVIHAGEKNRRERISLASAAAVRDAAGASAPVKGAAHPPDDGKTGSGQRTVGIVVLGAGAAGLVAGGVFGILAKSKWSQAQTDCGAGCDANSGARVEGTDAHSLATVSNVAFAAGGALAITGFIVWLVAPKAHATTGLRVLPFVGGTSAGMAASGSLPW